MANAPLVFQRNYIRNKKCIEKLSIARLAVRLQETCG